MVRRPERRDMFINEKILRRLMAKAYKGAGVYMGHFDGKYHIRGAGGSWEALILDTVIPKPILSQMVECSGTIPEDGRDAAETDPAEERFLNTTDQERRSFYGTVSAGLDEQG